jgi:hypothetical protein
VQNLTPSYSTLIICCKYYASTFLCDTNELILFHRKEVRSKYIKKLVLKFECIKFY